MSLLSFVRERVAPILRYSNPVSAILSVLPQRVATTIYSGLAATGTALLTKSPTATIGAFVGTSALIGAAQRNPTIAQEVVKAPAAVSNFAQNVGGLIAAPSVEQAQKTASENPLLTAGAAALGLYSVGRVAAPVIGGLLQREAIEEQTQALVGSGQAPQAPAQSSLPTGSDNYSTIPTDNSKPIENPTTTIRTGKKRRRKVSTIKDFRQINQRVNVFVQQRNTGVSMRKIYKGALLV